MLFRSNFKNGGMKKILKEMLANATSHEGATFGVQVEDGQRSNQDIKRGIWSNALNIAKKERIEYAKLHQIGDQIRRTTG